MPDPVIRRLPCAATLYLEVSADGLSLARLVVDVSIPDPSVIVANLPAPFDPDRGGAWEPPADPAEPGPRPRPVLVSIDGLPGTLRAEVA